MCARICNRLLFLFDLPRSNSCVTPRHSSHRVPDVPFKFYTKRFCQDKCKTQLVSTLCCLTAFVLNKYMPLLLEFIHVKQEALGKRQSLPRWEACTNTPTPKQKGKEILDPRVSFPTYHGSYINIHLENCPRWFQPFVCVCVFMCGD